MRSSWLPCPTLSLRRLVRIALLPALVGIFAVPTFAQTATQNQGDTIAPISPTLPALPGNFLGQQVQPLPGEEALSIPFIELNIREPGSNAEVAQSLQLLLLLAILTLAPSIIILTTSFIRIAIVFDFVKRALALQQVPPNQILMGIALFMTLFIMWPTIDAIYQDAYVPFANGEIEIDEAYTNFERPLRLFMYRQLNGDADNVRLFMRMSNLPRPQNLADVPTRVLIPAFILHELTVAFKIGILLFVPFIIIDMVIASTLMSMGMIMLPPIFISLPFKLILFVLIDGWNLLTQQLIAGFGGG